MHASYVMMMQFYRLYLKHQQENGDIITTSFERRVDELRHALQDIIASLDGFANVLEAIRGMKGRCTLHSMSWNGKTAIWLLKMN